VSQDDFDLEKFTPYLINRVGLGIAEAFQRELVGHGLTIKTWRILAVAYHYGELTQRQLAAHTSLDPSTLSRLVATLVRRRLLVSTPHARDSRATCTRLSAEGRKHVESLTPTARWYERETLRGLSEADVLKLQEVLRRMYENLRGLAARDEVPSEAEAPRRARRRSAR
jgi:MarR family transcriptional regulator, organic hydroperoxide resistance regulator